MKMLSLSFMLSALLAPATAGELSLLFPQDGQLLRRGEDIEVTVLAEAAEVGLENGLRGHSTTVAPGVVVLGQVGGPEAFTVSFVDGADRAAATILVLPEDAGYRLVVAQQAALEVSDPGLFRRFLEGLTTARLGAGVQRMWRPWIGQNALAGTTTALVCFTPGMQTACVVRNVGHAVDFLARALASTIDVMVDEGVFDRDEAADLKGWLQLGNLTAQTALNTDLVGALLTAVGEGLQIAVEDEAGQVGIKLAKDELDRVQALVKIVKR